VQHTIELAGSGNPIRIFIVENHLLVADTLAAFLNQQPDMLVVGNVGSVLDAATRAREANPHIVISDFHLNDGTGADAAAAIWHSGCEARLIFLTRDEHDTVRLAAIEVGASGVLYKSRAASEVIDGVRMVAGGGTLIPPHAVATLLQARRDIDCRRESLSRRETEVLRLMADGAPSREIATRLGIGYVTVRTHLRSLSSKLAAHSKVEAIVRARALDLID
jgi:DNA-binding NarL/FixJ family response regulator